MEPEAVFANENLLFSFTEFLWKLAVAVLCVKNLLRKKGLKVLKTMKRKL